MSDVRDSVQVNLAGEPDFVLGGAQVHPSSREVRFNGTLENVEPRVMQVLVALARRRGKVVSRDELVQQCWEGRVIGEDAINRCLAKVRRLTERMRGVTIETIPRVGYRLSEAPLPERGVERERRPSRRLTLVAAAAALLILVLGVLGYSIIRQGEQATRPRFAVLPFTALNSGEEMHLYGKGMAAATSAALDRSGLLLVSIAPLPATIESNPAEVGRRLGATFVVSGSVRQEGAVIRAFARVDEVAGATTVYSRMYQVPAAQKHLLPDIVGAGVAAAMSARRP